MLAYLDMDFGLEIDWDKEYHSIFYVYKNYFERIYKIPELQIKYKRKSISIYKNPSRGAPWEQYRVKDEEYIKKVWKKIIKDE